LYGLGADGKQYVAALQQHAEPANEARTPMMNLSLGLDFGLTNHQTKAKIKLIRLKSKPKDRKKQNDR
jgi:hypothetical protein